MAKMKTTGTLSQRVARMTHTLNINLRNAKKRGYADFAEYKFIEKQLTNSGFATKSGYAVEAKPAALAKRYTEEQLKQYEKILTSALQKAKFLKGKKGAKEYIERAKVFKERIEKSGAKIDIETVYDLVKLQSSGVWQLMKDNYFSSDQIVDLVQKTGYKNVSNRFLEMLDFYEQNGLPFNKNDVKQYILRNVDLKEIVVRNIKLYGIENIPSETIKKYGINAKIYKNL